MVSYGSMIEYDTSASPITMSVNEKIAKQVMFKFERDYNLPFSHATSSDGSRVTLTFEDSVDAETFLRHLKTATPDEYAAMTAE